MAVLERAGEERARGRRRLELAAVVAEADDERARIEAVERLEQDVDALVQEQLAEVDDRRPIEGEERLQALRVPLVGLPLVHLPRVRRVAARLGEELRERLVLRLRPELLDVDARRHLVYALDVADDLLEHLADVRRADEDRPCALERLPSPRREVAVAADRVLELRAVRLHGVRRACRRADRTSRKDMVREDEVGRQQLPHGAGVELDVAIALRARQVLELPRLEPFVAVDDEHRQDPADLRPHDARMPQVEALRVPLLAQHDDIVTGERPLARERARVHVRPGPSEQVAVPEEDPHEAYQTRRAGGWAGPSPRSSGSV